MAEIKVTQALRDTIKKYRKEIHLRGDVLSRSLKKNTSFISQLETGKLDTIDSDILNKIFDSLFAHETPEEKNRKISEILNELKLSLSDNELKRQEWMRIMDLQYRLIPISDSIIDYINDQLKELDLLPEDIIKRVNLNEALKSSFSEDEIQNMEDNKVYFSISDNTRSMTIKLNLPLNFLSDILNHKIVRCNFIKMQSIIYSILLYKGLDIDEAFEKSKQILFEYKFNTLLRKQHIPKDEPPENYLAPYDIEFRKHLTTLSDILTEINDRQPDFLNEILSTFIQNILKEPSLAFSVISKDITVLHKMSKQNKKNFIQEYKDLISKYANNSTNDQPKIETF